MSRISDPTAVMTGDGWQRIGQVCSAGRRSLWMRLEYNKTQTGLYDGPSEVAAIELCAGREGDDDYLKITKDNPQFEGLLGMFCSARFAVWT